MRLKVIAIAESGRVPPELSNAHFVLQIGYFLSIVVKVIDLSDFQSGIAGKLKTPDFMLWKARVCISNYMPVRRSSSSGLVEPPQILSCLGL